MKKALTAATLAFFARASHAATHALTFDETNICTINIHVGYSQPDQLDTRTLHWSADDYNELHGVAFADGGDGPSSHARIELQALGGPLTLTHLDHRRTRRQSTSHSYRARVSASTTFESAAALIPEPGTYALVMAGLALLGFVTKRRIAV